MQKQQSAEAAEIPVSSISPNSNKHWRQAKICHLYNSLCLRKYTPPMYICIYVCMLTDCVWRPAVDIRDLSLSLSTLFFKTGFHWAYSPVTGFYLSTMCVIQKMLVHVVMSKVKFINITADTWRLVSVKLLHYWWHIQFCWNSGFCLRAYISLLPSYTVHVFFWENISSVSWLARCPCR